MLGPRKVAIVGMGGVFPGGVNIEEFRNQLFAGKSMVRTWDEAAKFEGVLRSQVSAYSSIEESGFGAEYNRRLGDYPVRYYDTKKRIPDAALQTADIGSCWTLVSGKDALEQAGWQADQIESERTGVCVGSGAAGATIQVRGGNLMLKEGVKSRVVGPHMVDRSMVYKDSANLSSYFKTRGISESLGSACATGLGCIGYAARLISSGIQDRFLAGGVEGLSVESFGAFDAMYVLSTGKEPELSSRPFARDRNGFVCSFGAGVVALEALELAEKRSAKVLAVIDGYFNNSDGSGNMFAPNVDGKERLWRGLRASCGVELKPDVVNVHGTSTPVGDAMELFTVVDALGDDGYHISAPKSQFGHLLGAAGAVELIVSIMMLNENKVSPCLNSEDLNVELEGFQKSDDWKGVKQPLAAFRHLLPLATVEKPVNQVVTLNYGFGGTNAAMAVSQYSQG